ncbi:pentapeptide repeat-containing protein [Amycolatopsis sp. TRM77291]
MTAVGALIFTGLSFGATQDQLDIAQQVRVADRFTKSISQIGDKSADVRLGGIYGLERIMRDAPQDQPTVLDVLIAFIRSHAAMSTSKMPASDCLPGPVGADVQTALDIIGRRNKDHDFRDIGNSDYREGVRIELSDLCLPGAEIEGEFNFVQFQGANLKGAKFRGAKLRAAQFDNSILVEVSFKLSDLMYSSFRDADLSSADLNGVMRVANPDLTGANLTGATGR